MSELFFIELESNYFYFVFEQLMDYTELMRHLVNIRQLFTAYVATRRIIIIIIIDIFKVT